MMGDLTRNLSLHEFACQCGCGLMSPHPDLVDGLQEWVDRAGARKIILTSGGRCEARNKAVGGVIDSPHQPHPPDGWTWAADCYLVGAALPLRQQLIYALQVGVFLRGGVGVYWRMPGSIDRLHLDVRHSPARWAYVEGQKVEWEKAVRRLNTERGL